MGVRPDAPFVLALHEARPAQRATELRHARAGVEVRGRVPGTPTSTETPDGDRKPRKPRGWARTRGDDPPVSEVREIARVHQGVFRHNATRGPSPTGPRGAGPPEPRASAAAAGAAMSWSVRWAIFAIGVVHGVPLAMLTYHPSHRAVAQGRKLPMTLVLWASTTVRSLLSVRTADMSAPPRASGSP